MPTISFASSKGGAGKTTSAIILGSEVAELTSVTLIDADPAERLFRWSQLADPIKNMKVIRSKGEKFILDEIEEATQTSAFVLIDLEGAATRLASFAIGESDLVIVPSGEEQQDADAAIETLAEVVREGRARRRDILSAVLFCRTSAAVKSRLERHISTEMAKVSRVFNTQLHKRTSFSSLHNVGGGLRSLDATDVNGIDKAIKNAQAFTSEVIDILEEKDCPYAS